MIIAFTNIEKHSFSAKTEGQQLVKQEGAREGGGEQIERADRAPQKDST